MSQMIDAETLGQGCEAQESIIRIGVAQARQVVQQRFRQHAFRAQFLQAAAAKGVRTLNGGGMCVHQAVEVFAQLTGVAPDPARLQRAFATAVAAREAALSAVT